MRIGRIQLNAENRKRILRVLSALIAVLLIFFCFYHFTSIFDNEIKTMLVTEAQVEETLFGEAVLFRDEIAIASTYTGLSVPLVEPGSHVAKDTALVSVYQGGAEYTEALRIVDTYIGALTDAQNENDTLAVLSALSREIETLSRKVIDALEKGEAAASADDLELLRVLSNRVQALTDADFSLAEIIGALKSQREALLASSGVYETLSAPQSGYYYPDSDGAAQLCSAERLDTLTGGELQTLANTLRESEQTAGGAGTLVLSPEWYIAVPTDLSADALAAFTVGETYPVIFKDNADERIPMTLERTVERQGEEPAVLIFSTLRMPSGFSYDRLRSVYVVTETKNGFSIPEKAVHTLDGMTGVYVLEGSVVQFCRIEILHDLGARYLVKTTDPTPSGEYADNVYRYISLYDAMIVSGDSLFHGRVLS